MRERDVVGGKCGICSECGWKIWVENVGGICGKCGWKMWVENVIYVVNVFTVWLLKLAKDERNYRVTIVLFGLGIFIFAFCLIQ